MENIRLYFLVRMAFWAPENLYTSAHVPLQRTDVPVKDSVRKKKVTVGISNRERFNIGCDVSKLSEGKEQNWGRESGATQRSRTAVGPCSPVGTCLPLSPRDSQSCCTSQASRNQPLCPAGGIRLTAASQAGDRKSISLSTSCSHAKASQGQHLNWNSAGRGV